jgi:rubrerythrin
MRFCQVSELIDWIDTYHQALAEQYKVLANEAAKERAALLLNYLSEHHKVLAESIGKYETDAADSLLAIWSDKCPELNLPESVSELHNTLSGKNTEEIIKHVIEFHDILMDMYESLADEATNPSAKALFENLAEMERQEAMRTVRDAQRLEDY